MKVAFIEMVHFQYGLTMAELFKGHELIFFATEKIKQNMHEYNKNICRGKFYTIEKVSKNYDVIIETCKNEKVNWLFINPIFDSFPELLKIVTTLPCKKVITIHNWNYWLHPYWRSLRGWKEKQIKRKIVSACEYISVEDFMYNYLIEESSEGKKYSLLNIPFTLFHPQAKTYIKPQNDTNLRVVLPGSIHHERRRYEDVIGIIHEYANQNASITFSFAGPAIGKYGMNVIHELKKANAICSHIARFFDPEKEVVPSMFRNEMECADLVLSTSTIKFNALGKSEIIGKTKPTAAIQDMLSFELPGLLPQHLKVPNNLVGSIFNYVNRNKLKELLDDLLNKPKLLNAWKKQAALNSLNYTAVEIRKTLPFFK